MQVTGDELAGDGLRGGPAEGRDCTFWILRFEFGPDQRADVSDPHQEESSACVKWGPLID